MADVKKIFEEHKPFIVLFCISFIFHALYIYFTNLDLVPDEAHYWEWSRRLDISYYSKGPGVAYIIAFFTKIFGNTPFGVRFGTVFLSQITLLMVYVLTVLMFESTLAAFLTAIMIQIVPLFAAGAILMTTDSIYITFWVLALWSVYLVVKKSEPKYFYLFGLFVGLGFLGKYTMAMIYISLFIYFLSSKERRKLLNRTPFYLSLLLTLVLMSPVVIWSIKNDFVNYMHVFHQGKNQSAHTLVSIKYILEFWGGQLGVVTPFLFFLLMWAAFRAFKLPKENKYRENIVLLTCFGLPIFIIFALMGIKMRIHPNWPAVCYIPMTILGAGIASIYYEFWPFETRRFFHKYLYLTFGFAALLMVLGYNTDALRWLGEKTLPKESHLGYEKLDFKINKALDFFHNPKKDPTNRLKGWRELGKKIDLIMAKEDENKTFIFSSQYQVAGEVAFYTKKQYYPYCINLGRRLNQYDIWGGWDTLIGKNAIQVEDTKAELSKKVADSFERCELLEYFEVKRMDVTIKDWTIFKCYNFKGLEEEDNLMSY